MSGAAPRKRKWYSGELSKPLPYQPLLPTLPLLPPVACEPDEAAGRAVLRESMRRHNAQTVGQGLTELATKFIALKDHFAINSSRLGWERDLALSLGKRHEPLLFKGKGVAVSALFEKYSIDPEQNGADLNLVFKLAAAHVPGFRFADRPRAKGRFSTHDFVGLVMAVVAVQEHLRQSGATASDRAVAAVLQDPKRLRTIIPQRAADHISGLLTTSGYNKRSHRARLSDRALRGYLRQMREAETAYREGRASLFQLQYVEEVLPALRSMVERAGVGQS